MKKIFIILTVFITISCKAQIVDINTPSFEMQQGSYRKDINNELAPFLGTWEATWNNKKITLYLTKITHHYQIHPRLVYYYEDLVVGTYKVVDLTTGAILEDTTNITTIENIPIISSALARTKNMLCTLYMKRGVNAGDCAILSNVYLYRDLNNPNILTYKYFIDSYESKNCPYNNVDDIPVNIPKQQVTLHKI